MDACHSHCYSPPMFHGFLKYSVQMPGACFLLFVNWLFPVPTLVHVHVHVYKYMYLTSLILIRSCIPIFLLHVHVHVQFSRLGIQVSLATCIYVCLSGIWLGGWVILLSFLSYFFKLVCYAHVFPCTCMYMACT